METTKRYARTLEEAFGPYTSRDFVEPYRPMDRADKIVVIASCITMAGLIVMVVMGLL